MTMDQEERESAYGADFDWLPVTSVASGELREAAKDLYVLTVQIVNVCFVAFPRWKEWVLVDAGMPGSAGRIRKAAESLFGEDRPPRAIVLTHGHFDHVGGIVELIDRWDVPVYAHEAEMPHLTGKRSYPAPDPTVEGGWVAKLSRMFPHEPVDLGDRVRALPADGTVPFMPGWRYVHTPGHTPGHISLFREEDRALVAGDAFVTVRQDSLLGVVLQKPEISGPPRYLTPDWEAARESVAKLAALDPAVAVTGHGPPMSGEALSRELRRLARDFERIAVPDFGRYAKH
jgi:glyoxylase-like metal-dependent hydrolase (beta-lactamase superfamily II)